MANYRHLVIQLDPPGEFDASTLAPPPNLGGAGAYEPRTAPQTSRLLRLSAKNNVGVLTPAQLGRDGTSNAMIRCVSDGPVDPADWYFIRGSSVLTEASPVAAQRSQVAPLQPRLDLALFLEAGPTDQLVLKLAPGVSRRTVHVLIIDLTEEDLVELASVSPGTGDLSDAVPTRIDVGDPGTPGTAIAASRADHQHELPVPEPPTVVDRSAALAGVAPRVAREDHKHDVSTAAPIAAAGPVNLEGTAAALARADHRHRSELAGLLAGVPIGSRPAFNFAGAVLVVDNVVDDRLDVTITAAGLTAAAPTQIDVGDAAVVGVATDAARADHQHALPAPAAPAAVDKSPASAGAGSRVAREDHKHDVSTAAPIAAAGPVNLEGTAAALARADHHHRTELAGLLAGVPIGSRPAFNFAGAVLVVDNVVDDRLDVTITAAALTAAAPTQIDVGDAAVVGVATDAARADHQHALPAPAAPAAVDKSPASAGAGSRVAREDHKHDVTTAAPIAAAGPVNLEGTAAALARADHRHRSELAGLLAGVPIGSRPAFNFAGAVLVVDNVVDDRLDVTITAAGLTAAAPTQIDVGDAAVVGVATDAARADHQHALPAPAAPAAVDKSPASAGAGSRVAREDHKHDVATAAPIAAAGLVNLEGTAAALARADHRHRTELAGLLAGVPIGSRPAFNFTGAVLVVDNVVDDRLDVTITAAALTAAAPTQIDVGDAAVVGVATDAARADHQHALPAPAAPAAVDKSPASAGAGSRVAREDHKHDVSTAAPIVASGISNTEGTAASLARSDHKHRIELGVLLAGVLVGSRPSLNFGSGFSVADNPGSERVDVTLASAAAAPMVVAGSGTQALGAELVLMTGNITIPAGGTGRLLVHFSGTLQVGAVLIGTNGAQIRLRVNGTTVTNSTRQKQLTATLAVTISFDLEEFSTFGYVTGLPTGVPLTIIDVLASKLGAVSSASMVNERTLWAAMV